MPPTNDRSSASWRAFLGHYQDQILACDFFTVETVWLKTIYVLFFIELGTRRIHLAGCITAPDSTWLTQQARSTPFQAPWANSFAERWVRSAREECLDHILILNQNHLDLVMGKDAPKARRWLRVLERAGLAIQHDGFLVLTEPGAFWLHLAQNYFALSYANTSWTQARREPWPQQIRI